MRLALVFSILATSISAQAADPSSWPTQLDGFLYSDAPCDPRVAKEVATSSKDEIVRSVTLAQADESCRILKLKRPVYEDPEQVCPGVTPQTFASCYSAILDRVDKSSPPSISGHILLMSYAALYALKIKASVGNRDLAHGILIDTMIATVKSVGQHTPITALPRTKSAVTAADREKIALLERIDRQITREFVERTLGQLTRMDLSVGRGIASSNSEPPRAKQIHDLAVRWHFPDPKLKKDHDELQSELSKHPELPGINK